MKESAKARRQKRHYRRNKSQGKMNLVSLMDIFTILVFFLLVNASDVQTLPSPKDLDLPESSAEKQAEALNLARLAKDCGAEAIALIPRIEDAPVARSEQRGLLKDALNALQPMLEKVGMVALIECLGFSNSSLRLKADAVAVLDDIGRPACFGLIHDTFHHALAEETAIFADLTRLVHISGVVDQQIGYSDMTDVHRGLVDGNDTLGNLTQIAQLRSAGYVGPFSFEAFSPSVHNLNDPKDSLSESATFISSKVASMAA